MLVIALEFAIIPAVLAAIAAESEFMPEITFANEILFALMLVTLDEIEAEFVMIF